MYEDRHLLLVTGPFKLQGKFEETSSAGFEFDPDWRLEGRPSQQSNVLSRTNVTEDIKTDGIGNV